MTTAPKPYVIQPGDTLLTIALRHELDPDEIWDHAKNAKLKERRDPEMLAPGEVLFIPPPEPPTLTVIPQGPNRFRAKVPKVDIHLSFEDESGPMADEPYEVTGLAEPIEGTLDGDGQVTLTVPALTRRLLLTLTERDTEHEIELGHLDPIDAPTGLRARLLHQSFLPAAVDDIDPFVFTTQAALEDTVRSFQMAHGLEPTGFLDPSTAKRLEEAHGS